MDKDTIASEWFKTGEKELNSAKNLRGFHPQHWELICYLSQQSCEKFLKGYLVLQDVAPPKVHDLTHLCALCADFHKDFDELLDACAVLTQYGVRVRYPFEVDVDQQKADRAFECANVAREFVSSLAPALFMGVGREDHEQQLSQDESEPAHEPNLGI